MRTVYLYDAHGVRSRFQVGLHPRPVGASMRHPRVIVFEGVTYARGPLGRFRVVR